MGEQMTKEQVVDVTIKLLESVEIPVKCRTAAETICGAINNLRIVLDLCEKEHELARQEHEGGEEDVVPDSDAE